MKKFKKIYIEITNVCNLKCDFCPQTKRSNEFMSIEFFEHILKQVKTFTDYIYLHVKGEPLLHPRLSEFLVLAEQYGLKVNITTNGTLIKKAEDALLLSKSLRQVNFSLHSFDANTIDSSIDEYLNRIFGFIDAAKKTTNIITALRLWNLEEASGDIERNSHILRRIENHFNLDYKIEEKLQPGRGTKLYNNVYLNQAQKFIWPELLLTESDNTGFCYGLRDQIAILADGTVVPCCLDGEGVINLGNVKTASFEEILKGGRATAIYEGFNNRKIVEELCKKCDYRRRFSS